MLGRLTLPWRLCWDGLAVAELRLWVLGRLIDAPADEREGLEERLTEALECDGADERLIEPPIEPPECDIPPPP